MGPIVFDAQIIETGSQWSVADLEIGIEYSLKIVTLNKEASSAVGIRRPEKLIMMIMMITDLLLLKIRPILSMFVEDVGLAHLGQQSRIPT